MRARLLHLTADLADRAGHLLGRRGDRLDVGGGLLGGGGDDARKLLGGVGRLGQRIGRGLQLGGGRRHAIDDAADRLLELVGQMVHRGLALGRELLLGGSLLRRLALLGRPFLSRSAFLLRLLLRFQPRALDRVVLEHVDRAGHGADLVGAILPGNLDAGVSVGQLAHRLRHRGQRSRDHPPEDQPDPEHQHDHGEHAPTGHQHQIPADRRHILGGGHAAGEHGDHVAVLLADHAGMAAGATVLLGSQSVSLNDGQAVAIGVADKAPDGPAGLQGLLIDCVQRQLRALLRRRLRHVGARLRVPDAPQLARILLVAALEPAVEDLDGDVLADR